MVSILLTLNALICVALVVIILLQRSDPASGGMFGGAGGGSQPAVRNPLAKPTAILAGLFLLFSVITAVVNKGGDHVNTIMHVDADAPAEVQLPEADLLQSLQPAPAEASADEPVTETDTQ